MADQVTVTNMPDGGSKERVAYDLYARLVSALPKDKSGVDRIEQCLNLYETCLTVVNRGRIDVSKLK